MPPSVIAEAAVVARGPAANLPGEGGALAFQEPQEGGEIVAGIGRIGVPWTDQVTALRVEIHSGWCDVVIVLTGHGHREAPHCPRGRYAFARSSSSAVSSAGVENIGQCPVSSST